MTNKRAPPRRGKGKPHTSMASRADKYKLYELSVQSEGADIDFIDDTFLALKKRRAARLREDFCGTANNSCAWVKRRSGNHALAVDHDPLVLEWVRKHHVAALTKEQIKRIRLLDQDVLRIAPEIMDIVMALNFSYWVFRERRTMVRYFRRVHSTLATDGMFFLDAFGGYEAMREMRESTRHRNFTYIWDQAGYDPITGDYLCKIHYKFSDGSTLREAFVYHWRLWTLPELIEMLAEAEFRVTVYWEGTAPDGSGNGVFLPATNGEADACWIAYLAAEKTDVRASFTLNPHLNPPPSKGEEIKKSPSPCKGEGGDGGTILNTHPPSSNQKRSLNHVAGSDTLTVPMPFRR